MLLGDDDRGRLSTAFVIAIYGGQLSAKYVCPKWKYRITLRTVVNYKIFEWSVGGIRIASIC